MDLGDVRGATKATKRSLALDPTRSPAWNNLGILLMREGKWQEAVEALKRALDCDPQNTGAMLNASEPLVRVGKTGQAVQILRRATKIAPDKFRIWTNLASLYVRLGDRANALSCFKKARELAPQRYQTEIDECIRDAEKLPETLSAAALLANGRTSDAKEQLRQTLQEHPDDNNAWQNLGLCHLHDHEYRDARECFAHVHQLDAEDGFAVCRLIELAALEGDLKDAEKWCGTLESMPEGRIPAIAFRARALAQCNQHQKAKALILQAVRENPTEVDILIACGDVMMWHPKSETAMTNATKAYQRAGELLELSGRDIGRQREIEARLRQARENLLACTDGGQDLPN